METLNKHKNIVKSVLNNHLGFPTRDYPYLQDQLIIDPIEQHFIQIVYGWKNYDYVHHVVFHIEVKEDGKVWIHENRTDVNIEEELMEMGISEDWMVYAMIEPTEEVLNSVKKLQEV